jgi:hypothetical protein
MDEDELARARSVVRQACLDHGWNFNVALNRLQVLVLENVHPLVAAQAVIEHFEELSKPR